MKVMLSLRFENLRFKQTKDTCTMLMTKIIVLKSLARLFLSELYDRTLPIGIHFKSTFQLTVKEFISRYNMYTYIS